MAKAKKLTELEILKAANFLDGWAKSKPISKISAESTFHKSGKWMTKIDTDMSEALREAGFAVGSVWSFKMDRKAVKAAVKAAEAKGIDIYAIN